MDREDLFWRNMAELGVRPLHGGEEDENGRQTPADGNPEDEVDGWFMAAMDRDTPPSEAGAEEKPRGRGRSVPRKLKLRKMARLELDDELDLHGKTKAEAVAALAAFVRDCYAAGDRTVAVITGKGRHAKRGVGVLGPEVERWIRGERDPRILSYAAAPRAHGGKGAWIVFLKKDRR